MTKKLERALTTDVRGAMVRGLHLGVDVDPHLFLFGHRGVPILHLLNHPILERLADDGSADIDDPPLRRLRKVWLVRQVLCDLGILPSELADTLEREVIVPRHVHSLDLVVLQGLLLASDDVLEKVHRHVLWMQTWISGSMIWHLPYLGT